MLVKSDTTSNDTIHLLDAMVVRLMLSRNSRELVRLCSESAMSSLRWLNIHLDNLYAGESTSETVIRSGLPLYGP